MLTACIPRTRAAANAPSLLCMGACDSRRLTGHPRRYAWTDVPIFMAMACLSCPKHVSLALFAGNSCPKVGGPLSNLCLSHGECASWPEQKSLRNTTKI